MIMLKDSVAEDVLKFFDECEGTCTVHDNFIHVYYVVHLCY